VGFLFDRVLAGIGLQVARSDEPYVKIEKLLIEPQYKLEFSESVFAILCSGYEIRQRLVHLF
tara:strand:- start:297 stop:482 length:186 start_codon:yes stop_codon:yes gene_type:complete